MVLNPNPTPIEGVEDAQPVPVQITNVQSMPAPPQPSVAPKTTEQEDITLAGQRRVNLIWEYTQALVAGLVVVSNMAVGVAQGLGYSQEVQSPSILANSLFLVIGFYFSRTNHEKIGGVGPKVAASRYEGR